ncbi:sodium-dependent transporter [Clostridium vitabionis]|jgi:NSS family neurotransmitter:Na+ symporter|uniref:sodium-dependent transporter n=1 Tax=Clostridium vitabionis TaxID=2784388 RepID=UPI00188D2C0B|nr:sodium-dependent transporter [Clostridium vitabionis]
METRETLGSRLGFILLSAGCAIGIGNVWRFPYITGQYGGGLFVLIYIIFLILLGIPLMTMEYSVGRASRRSIYPAFRKLEKTGTKWHIWGYFAMAGNYVLLFFYSVVSGWILYYAYLMASGQLENVAVEKIDAIFAGMMGSPEILVTCELIVVAITAVICGIGLQKSVESVSKVVMIALLAIMVILGLRSLTLPGAAEGVAFYLKPDLSRAREAGIGNVIYAALNQSFFTLSIGMGGMEIYGSYIDRKKSLVGEASIVTALDTFVALVAGLIIFPACVTYGVEVKSGPSLIFKTLPLVFANMAGGRVWGTLFFIFLFFAALSTMIGVFENDQAFLIDLLGMKRRTAGIINGLVIGILSIPCALGFNVWSSFQPLRAGNTVMDLEDFFVSNFCLPVGSLIFALFCTRKLGWGFDSFLAEANQGEGWKISPRLRGYLSVVLPIVTAFLLTYGIVTYF